MKDSFIIEFLIIEQFLGGGAPIILQAAPQVVGEDIFKGQAKHLRRVYLRSSTPIHLLSGSSLGIGSSMGVDLSIAIPVGLALIAIHGGQTDFTADGWLGFA